MLPHHGMEFFKSAVFENVADLMVGGRPERLVDVLFALIHGLENIRQNLAELTDDLVSADFHQTRVKVDFSGELLNRGVRQTRHFAEVRQFYIDGTYGTHQYL